MNIQEEQTIVLDLDTHDAVELILDPALNYDNIFQRNLGIYKVVTGKRKHKMLHMKSNGNILQPKTSCDEWNPNIGFKLSPSEMGVCDYEINGEQCPDEFQDGCLENLVAAPGELNRMESLLGLKPEYNAIEMAMIMQIRKDVVNDVYKIGWFGNENFGQLIEEDKLNLSESMSPKQIANMVKMMEHCNGWWSEIIARAQLDKSNVHRVRYLDTNNGTMKGNAMRPENICRYLKMMRTTADPLLQFWGMSPNQEKPCYLLQKGLFDALVAYYESVNGCCDAYRLKMEGLDNDMTLTFQGYQVIMMPEWTMYDFECGNMNPETGYSYTQRAIFTAKQNFCSLSDTGTIEGRSNSSFAIQKDPSLRAKGKSYLYGCFSFGYGIAQPRLLVAGWNSSRNYV